jgi:hypothetical protein
MGVYDRPEQYEYKPPADVVFRNMEDYIREGEAYREKKRREKEINHRLTLEENQNDSSD